MKATKGLVLSALFLLSSALSAAPPSVTSTAITSINANAVYGYYPEATDADGDDLNWSIKQNTILPVWLSLTGDSNSGKVTTLAGSGTNGDTLGTGTLAEISYPAGVAVDSAGNVFFTEYFSHKIKKISPAGVVTLFAGSSVSGNVDATAGNARFNSPKGLAFDASGNLYVVDNGNHQIRKITPAGVVTTFAGSGSTGNADGTGAAAGFNAPTDIVIDSAGNFFVTDSVNKSIRKITPAGEVSTFVALSTSAFDFPRGIGIDSSNVLYVSDYTAHRISKVTPAGVVSVFAGNSVGFANGNGTNALFNGPIGIAVDSFDQIFVADVNNSVIRKITQSGDVTTFAGTGVAGFADNKRLSAQFNFAFRFAFSRTNQLFIADTDNHRIRQLNAPYHLTGTPLCADLGNNAVALSVSDGTNSVDHSFSISVANSGDCTVRAVTHNGTALNGFQEIYDLANDGDVLEFTDGVYTITAFDFNKALTLKAKNYGQVQFYNPFSGNNMFWLHKNVSFKGIQFNGGSAVTLLRDSGDVQILFEDAIFHNQSLAVINQDNGFDGILGDVIINRAIFSNVPRAVFINDGGGIRINNALFLNLSLDLALIEGTNEGANSVVVNNYVASNSVSNVCEVSSAALCTLNNSLNDIAALSLPNLVLANGQLILNQKNTTSSADFTDFGNVHVSTTQTNAFAFTTATQWDSITLNSTEFLGSDISTNSNLLAFSSDESSFTLNFSPTVLGLTTSTLTLSKDNSAYSFNITGTGTNAAPIAENDTGSLTEDDAQTSFAVLANDSDADSDTLSIQQVTLDLASKGVASHNGTAVLFTPAANFNGNAALTYVVSDGIESASAVLTLSVASVDDTPIALDDTETILEDAAETSFSVLANDSDGDGDSLTITAATINSAQGSISNTASEIRYTPATNFNGLAAISYTISDGALSATASLNITVTAVEDAPIAVNDLGSMIEDGAQKSFTVLANDSEVDGQNFSIQSASVSALQGTVTHDGTLINFTPTANFNGDAIVSYTIVDDSGETATATLTIAVTAVSDAPIAVNDTATIIEDASATAFSVLDNDSDVDGDGLIIQSAAITSGQGTVSFTDTAVSYTPTSNFNGTVVIRYVISDGALTATADLTITVTAVADAPIAVNDTATITEDASATVFSVLDNDSEVDGQSITIQSATVNASEGSVSHTATTLSFTPAANFFGVATVSYTISDGDSSASAQLIITVTGTSDAPVANDDAVDAVKDVQLRYNPLSNDIEVDKQALTITQATLDSGAGSFSFNANEIIYTPTTGNGSSATISYQIVDTESLSSQATITVSIRGGNNAPVATPDSVTLDEDTVTTISPVANDSDADNDALVMTAATVDSGSLSFNDSQIIYTPEANFNGTATINYTVSDSFDTASSTIALTINALNDSPTGAVVIEGTVAENQTLNANISSIADNDGLGTFSYQWQKNGSDLANETTASYTLSQSDVGSIIRVVVAYQDGQNNNEVLTSADTISVVNVSHPVSGTVSILGTAQEDETLTVQSNVSDADGLGTFNYQWKRDGQAISAATATSYQLVQADVGAVITVTLSYEDGEATLESKTSAATTAVLNVNDAVSGTASISGTATEDVTLSIDNNLSDEDGLGAFSYQWQRNGSAINAATLSSYTLTQADVTAAITVAIAYTDAQGTLENYVTAATTAVVNVSHGVAGSASIVGTLQENETLTISNSLSDADGLGSFSYQWLQEGVVIQNETATTLTLNQSLVGKKISVQIAYTDGENTNEIYTTALTAAIANVNDAPTGSISLVGTAEEDSTLSITSTVADQDGLGAFSYQWQRDGSNIDGATQSTFTLSQIDVGSLISVVVSYLDLLGANETVSSAQTTAIVNVSHAPAGTLSIVGNAIEGQTLSVNNQLTDQDGLGAFSIQWLSNGLLIDGATSDTLALTQSDVATTVSVRVAYTDGEKTEESVTSAATTAITNVSNPVEGSIIINGLVQQFETLSITNGLSDKDGLGIFSYQWYHDNQAIPGETGSALGLYQYNVGKKITLKVTYTDGEGTLETYITNPTIAVINVNEAPIQVKDDRETNEDTSIIIDVLANDTDPDGDTLTVSEVKVLRGSGVASIVNNKVLYVPALNQTGNNTIRYRTSDGIAEPSIDININVLPINDAPIAVADHVSTLEDTAITVNVLANDSDVDSSLFLVAPRTTLLSGSGTIEAINNQIRFTPSLNFTGQAVIEYQITDGSFLRNTNLVIDVTAVNDAPRLADDFATAADAETITVDVLANDQDIDGDRLTIISAEILSGSGVVSIVNNKLVFTASKKFNGEVVIRHNVGDGEFTRAADLFVTVTAVAEPLKNLEAIKNLSPITAFLSLLPVNVYGYTEETVTDGDKVQYALTGSVNMVMPVFGQEIKLEGADVLVYTETVDGASTVNTIFIKYDLHAFLSRTFGDKIPQEALDALPKVPVIIGYSNIDLDETTLKKLPLPVRTFFDGIFSAEFGIPIFNRDGSAHFFFPIGYQNIPQLLKQPLENLGIDRQFIIDNVGVDGSFIYDVSVGNIAVLMDTLALVIPGVEPGSSGIGGVPTFEVGIVLPSLSLPIWLTEGIDSTGLSEALAFQPDLSGQLRHYMSLALDFDGSVSVDAKMGVQGALRVAMPNIINAQARKDLPKSDLLDIRADLFVSATAKAGASGASGGATAEVGVGGSIALINLWKYPFGIPNLAIGNGIFTLGATIGVTAKVSAGAGAGISASVLVGLGGDGYCLNNEGDITGGGTIGGIIGVGGFGGAGGGASLEALGFNMLAKGMTVADAIRCGTGVIVGTAAGASESVTSLLPAEFNHFKNQVISSNGSIKDFVDLVVETPLKIQPIGLFLEQLRFADTSIYFALPGVELEGHLESDVGLIIKGGAEYRTSASSNDWKPIGVGSIEGSFAGGLKGSFRLGDFNIANVISMNNVASELTLTLLPPVAEFKLSGTQTLLDLSTSTNVVLSSKEGIHINSKTAIDKLGEMSLDVNTFGSLFSYPNGLDLRGKAAFNVNPNHVSEQIHGAFNTVNSGAGNAYRSALRALESEDSVVRSLEQQISNIEADIQNKTNEVDRRIRPHLNYVTDKLNGIIDNREYHYWEGRYYDRKHDEAHWTWWCGWRGNCRAYYWGAARYHWGLFNVYHRLVPAAVHLINLAKDNLDNALYQIARSLSPRLNALRVSIAAVKAAKEAAYITVKGLQAANSALSDVANAIRSASNVIVHDASAEITSYNGFTDGIQPINVNLDVELGSIGLRCPQRFNLYLFNPVASFNSVINNSFNRCISDYKNARSRSERSDVAQRISSGALRVEADTDQIITEFNSQARTAHGNDNISDAIDLGTTETVSITGNNADGTIEANEFDQVLQKASVWYQWQPPTTDYYEITAIGDDTAIHVHLAGDNAGTAASLVIADVRPVESGKIIDQFNANQKYLIAVSSQVGEPGAFSLNIEKVTINTVPANDNFEDAIALTELSGQVNSNNLGAGTQSNESTRDTYGLNNTVWYHYVAPQEGIYTFTTLGSEFDTVLRAYQSADGTLANAVSFKVADDMGLDPRSELNLRLTANQKVWISVGSKFGALGSIQLNWRNINVLSADWLGDDFADAITLDTNNTSISVTNYGASIQVGELLHAGIENTASIWFRFTPNQVGEYIFDTAGSAIDTVMALYEGNSLSSLSSLAANDDSVDQTSRFKVSLNANQTYFIAVASKDESEGVLQLNYKLNDLNDHYVDADDLAAAGSAFDVDLTDASIEANEPDYALVLASEQSPDVLLKSLTLATAADANAPAVDLTDIQNLVNDIYQSTLKGLQDKPLNKTLWWHYTPTQDGELKISSQSDVVDSAIFIFEGASYGALQAVKWNDNSGGTLNSQVRYSVKANTTYHLAITARNAGKVALKWEFVLPAGQTVSNDTPATAIDLTDNFSVETVYSVSENNTYASGNDNDVQKVAKLLSSQSDKRLWWSLRNTSAGYFNLNTQGSSVDTLIEVYQVTAKDELIFTAFNDDVNNLGNSSKLSFAAKANTSYLVAVDSMKGEEGHVVLNYHFTAQASGTLANDLFSGATVLEGASSQVSFDNTYSQYQFGEPVIGPIEKPNSVWFKWQSPMNGVVNVATSSDSVDTIIGFYQGNSLASLSLVKFNDNAELTGTNSAVKAVVVADANYYIAVATDKGAQGTINLTLNAQAISAAVVDNSTLESSALWDNQNASIRLNLSHNAPALVTGSDLVIGSSSFASSRWWHWTAPSSGQYQFSSEGSQLDPAIEVYQGNANNDIVLLAYDDASSNAASQVSIQAQSGENYSIRITSAYRRQGDVQLNVARTGDANATQSATEMSGKFIQVAAGITESGTKTWLWTAEKAGKVNVVLSRATAANQSIKAYLKDGLNRSEVNAIDVVVGTASELEGEDTSSTGVFYQFAVVEGASYDIEVSSNAAVLGDAFLRLSFDIDPITQVSSERVGNNTTSLKALLPQVLDNRLSKELDVNLISADLLAIVNAILATSYNADEVLISLKVVDEVEEAGVKKARKVRLTATDLLAQNILLSIEIDPNRLTDKVVHQQIALSNNLENKIVFDDATSVKLSFDDKAFNKTVSQAFVSARQELLSAYPDRTVTPQFQGNAVFEIALNLFDSNKEAYDLDSDGVLNHVVVRMPIDKDALLVWLNDNSLSLVEANQKIKTAIAQGLLEMVSADSTEDLLMSKSAVLASSKTAVVDLDQAYIEFETTHFSAFMLVAKGDSSLIGAVTDTTTADTTTTETSSENTSSDSQSDFHAAVNKFSKSITGGCSLGGDKAAFDPSLIILLVLALIGLNRRRIVAISRGR